MTLVGYMGHRDVEIFDADGDVHCTTDARYFLTGNPPVGKIAVSRNFDRPDHRMCEVAAPDHREGLSMVEYAASRKQRNVILACIDEVGILLASRRYWSHAENAVFTMNENLAIWNEIRRD